MRTLTQRNEILEQIGKAVGSGAMHKEACKVIAIAPCVDGDPRETLYKPIVARQHSGCHRLGVSATRNDSALWIPAIALGLLACHRAE